MRTEKDCTLVAGNSHKGGKYDGSIDMGKGFSFDFPHFLETATKTESLSGLKLNTPLLKLGGKLWVYDNAATYENAVWKNSHRFMVLDTKDVEKTEGDMDAIASTVTESDKVEFPYSYKGSWTMEWLDSDKDGIQDELYAIWTPESDGGSITIDPGKRGALAENSLWSSATNRYKKHKGTPICFSPLRPLRFHQSKATATALLFLIDTVLGIRCQARNRYFLGKVTAIVILSNRKSTDFQLTRATRITSKSRINFTFSVSRTCFCLVGGTVCQENIKGIN